VNSPINSPLLLDQKNTPAKPEAKAYRWEESKDVEVIVMATPAKLHPLDASLAMSTEQLNE
jgi:hypothetical protein